MIIYMSAFSANGYDLLQAQDTAYVKRSLILAESSQRMSSESPLVLEQPGASVRNIQGDCNQPRTRECFVLTAQMNTTTPGSKPYDVSSSSRPFASYRVSERSEENRDIHMPIIKTAFCKAQNEITKEISEAIVVVSTNREEADQQMENGTTKFQQNRTVIDTFERVAHSEDYLQPVDNNNLQVKVLSTDSSRMCHGKALGLTRNRPQPKPRIKNLEKKETNKLFQCKDSTFTGTPLSLQFTNMLESNSLYDREAAQHCTNVRSADQSNGLIPQTKTRHVQQHDYQNERRTTTPYKNALQPTGSVESPYTRVLSNTNWEVSSDRLSLFERIGGGSFGQVWKGAVLDVAGAKGWSFVAVKMLKGRKD